MSQLDSRAWAACSLRGCARNVMPKAFTKHAAASAPVSASIAPLSGNISRTRLSSSCRSLAASDW